MDAILDDDALHEIFTHVAHTSNGMQILDTIAQVCKRFAVVVHMIFDHLEERKHGQAIRADWQEWLTLIRASAFADRVLVCSQPERMAEKLNRVRAEAERLATQADGIVDEAYRLSATKRLAVKCHVFGEEWLDEPAGTLQIPTDEVDVVVRLVTHEFTADPRATFGRKFNLAGVQYVTRPCPYQAYYQKILIARRVMPGRDGQEDFVLAANWRYPGCDHAFVFVTASSYNKALPFFFDIVDGRLP